jgi:hypothetical protein
MVCLPAAFLEKWTDRIAASHAESRSGGIGVYFAKGANSVTICANTFGVPAITSPLYK